MEMASQPNPFACDVGYPPPPARFQRSSEPPPRKLVELVFSIPTVVSPHVVPRKNP
jgi:hypothetical protein